METKRQRIERVYHDRWAKSMVLENLLVREAFEAATSVENRYALASLSPIKGKKILDIGCGAGETSVYFALKGARVDACDLSPEMIRAAEKLAGLHGANIRTKVGAAESLPFPDGEFDLVFGNGILHHSENVPALREIRRVLKPGGKAAFIEPLKHNPVIGVYRLLASKNRTPTERPLGFEDFERFKKVFPLLKHREFWLTALAVFLKIFLIERLSPSKVRYWKRIIEESNRYEGLFNPLKNFDDQVLRTWPWLGRYCWNTVITVEK